MERQFLYARLLEYTHDGDTGGVAVMIPLRAVNGLVEIPAYNVCSCHWDVPWPLETY